LTPNKAGGYVAEALSWKVVEGAELRDYSEQQLELNREVK